MTLPNFPIVTIATQAAEPLPTEGSARVLLVVLAAVMIAIVGLIGLTIMRIALRRARTHDQTSPSQATPTESPWTVAGQRAKPIDADGAETSEDDDDDLDDFELRRG